MCSLANVCSDFTLEFPRLHKAHEPRATGDPETGNPTQAVAVSRQISGKTTSKRDEVCQLLRELILRGNYRPATKLRQAKLAKRFAVTQGVVREALLELRQLGLVESIDRRGMYVTRLDDARLREAVEVRAVHEGLAARRCCERVTRSDVRGLIQIAEEIYQLGRAGKIDQTESLDGEFHARLIRLSGSSMLARLAENYLLFRTTGAASRDAKVVRAEHLAILTAIQDARADDAERLMRRHIDAATSSSHAQDSGRQRAHAVGDG